MRTQLFFFTEDVLTGSIGQISLGSTLKLCEVVTWALSWFDAPCRAAYLFFKATRQGAVATEVAGTGCHCFLASKSSRLARWREDREPSLWGVLSACTPLAQPPFFWSHWTQVLSLLPPSRSTGSGTPCSQRPGHLRVCLHGSSAWVPHFFWHWLLVWTATTVEFFPWRPTMTGLLGLCPIARRPCTPPLGRLPVAEHWVVPLSLFRAGLTFSAAFSQRQESDPDQAFQFHFFSS